MIYLFSKNNMILQFLGKYKDEIKARNKVIFANTGEYDWYFIYNRKMFSYNKYFFI